MALGLLMSWMLTEVGLTRADSIDLQTLVDAAASVDFHSDL